MVNERSDLTVTMLRFDPERDPIVIDEWEWDNPHIAAEEEAVARGIQEAFEREPPVMFVSMTEEITTLSFCCYVAINSEGFQREALSLGYRLGSNR